MKLKGIKIKLFLYFFLATRSPPDSAPGDKQPEGIGDSLSDRATASGQAELRALRGSESKRGQTSAGRGNHSPALGFPGHRKRVCGR